MFRKVFLTLIHVYRRVLAVFFPSEKYETKGEGQVDGTDDADIPSTLKILSIHGISQALSRNNTSKKIK